MNSKKAKLLRKIANKIVTLPGTTKVSSDLSYVTANNGAQLLGVCTRMVYKKLKIT